MVRVTFDVEDLGLFAFFDVAAAIHDDAARDRAIGAGVSGLSGLCELEGPYMRGNHRLRTGKTKRSQGRPRHTRPRHFHEMTAGDFDVHGRFLPPGLHFYLVMASFASVRLSKKSITQAR